MKANVDSKGLHKPKEYKHGEDQVKGRREGRQGGREAGILTVLQQSGS